MANRDADHYQAHTDDPGERGRGVLERRAGRRGDVRGGDEMIHSFVQRWVWWLFDRTPERFQDWAEAWARTLILHRSPDFQRQVREYSNELAYEQVQIAEQGTAIAHETWPEW